MSQWSFQATPASLVAATILLLILVLFSILHVRRSPNPRRVATLETIRLLAVLCLLVTLLRPERVHTLDRDQQPQVVLLTDNTASMRTTDVQIPGQDAPIARRQWLQDQLDADLTAPLQPRYHVTVQPLAPPAAATLTTDLNAPLARLLDTHPDLRAVILLSDGDWTSGGSPLEAATRLAVNQIRIYPVAIGSQRYLPDVVLDHVKPPAYTLLGEHAAIPFRVRNHLPIELRTEVRLQQQGRTVATKPLLIPPGGMLQESILWKSNSLGEQSLTLDIPLQDGETNADNNHHTFPISVRQQKLSVLLIDSRPRWEYRFIRNALSRDPGVKVDCLLLHPGLPPGDGPDYIQSFPESRDQLATYDVIFLGDVGIGPDELTSEQAELIAGVIEQLGSGLVLLPGSRGRHFTLLDSPLGDLIPVVLDPEEPAGIGRERMATLDLTSAGADHLLTMLANTPSANRRLWQQLPGFYWSAPVIRSRPGSEVLAVHGMLRNRWGRIPLLVTRPHGQGNILFMGTDSAWRWRKGVEDTWHYRFWGQVVRWMAHPRHLAQDAGIRLVYTPENPQQGERIMLHASVTDAAGFPLAVDQVSATVSLAESWQTRLVLQPEQGGWGVYTGSFAASAAGPHTITISPPGSDRALSTTINVSPRQLERLGQPANHRILAELARVTDGTFATHDELAATIQAVNLLPEREQLQVRLLLWSKWWWGLLILLLLAAFWTLRKFAGLV